MTHSFCSSNERYLVHGSHEQAVYWDTLHIVYDIAYFRFMSCDTDTCVHRIIIYYFY